MTAGPFEVEAVVEQHPDGTDSHHVRVALSPVAWRELVGDVARGCLLAMAHGEPLIAKLTAAGVGGNDVERMDALTRLVQILEAAGQGPASWLLTTDQADPLIIDLEHAADDPSECPTCHRWIQRPSSLNTLTGCGRCAARQNGENP
jgi:hypothetical protein